MAVTRQQFKDLAANFVDNVFADFTKQFTIEQFTRTPDGQGGFTVQWSTFAAVTGFVKHTKGMQVVENDKIDADYMTKFSFEFIPGITNEMRILYDGEYYNIDQNIPIQEVDVFINIMAKRDDAT